MTLALCNMQTCFGNAEYFMNDLLDIAEHGLNIIRALLARLFACVSNVPHLSVHFNTCKSF